MIVHIAESGSDMPGLVSYLYGPGRANEHTNPRMVAGSGTLPLEYAGESLSSADARALGRVVEQAWARSRAQAQVGAYLGRYPARGGIALLEGDEQGGSSGRRSSEHRPHVMHISLSVRVDLDGELGDDRWGQIASDFVREMGMSDCEWVAVHHGLSGAGADGNDHIHLAVCQVQNDGRWWRDFQSKARARRAVDKIERKYGLTPVRESVQQRGVPHIHRAEYDRAERAGWREPERVTLTRGVRACATAARSEADFVNLLRRHGLRPLPRYAAGGTDRVVGYTVQLSGDGKDTPQEAKHFRYGAAKLAPDLTLTELRRQWSSTPEDEAAALDGWARRVKVKGAPRDTEAERARRLAATREQLDQVVAHLAGVDPRDREQWRQAAAGAAGVYAALAAGSSGREAAAFARRADQLARSGMDRLEPHARRREDVHHRSQWAMLSRQVNLAVAAGSPSRTAGWLAILRQLRHTADAIAAAHEARQELARAHELRAVAATPMVRPLDVVAGPPMAAPIAMEGAHRAPEEPARNHGFERG